MMLTINAPIFDIEGHETIRSPSPAGLFDFTRRVSRVPTLDGGAAINDFGYSDSDRTLQIEWRSASRQQIENIRRMAQIYGRLIVSFSDGCFIGAPESFAPQEDTSTLTILVERRLDQ